MKQKIVAFFLMAISCFILISSYAEGKDEKEKESIKSLMHIAACWFLLFFHLATRKAKLVLQTAHRYLFLSLTSFVRQFMIHIMTV